MRAHCPYETVPHALNATLVALPSRVQHEKPGTLALAGASATLSVIHRWHFAKQGRRGGCDVRFGLKIVAVTSPNFAMLGLAAALAGFFVAVVKQTEIFGPQNAAVRELFSENDFRHATHHADPSVLRRVFGGIRIGPACIPVHAVNAPSLRLGVAVLKQISKGLVVVVFVDPVSVEG